MSNNNNQMNCILGKCLDKRKQSGKLRTLPLLAHTTDNEEYIDFGSNDYLSMSRNRKVFDKILFKHKSFYDSGDEGAQNNTNKTRLNGSGGSRLVTGNSTLCEKLENHLARVYNREKCLVMNSGYNANVAVFSCIPQPGQIVLYDE